MTEQNKLKTWLDFSIEFYEKYCVFDDKYNVLDYLNKMFNNKQLHFPIKNNDGFVDIFIDLDEFSLKINTNDYYQLSNEFLYDLNYLHHTLKDLLKK